MSNKPNRIALLVNHGHGWSVWDWFYTVEEARDEESFVQGLDVDDIVIVEKCRVERYLQR